MHNDIMIIHAADGHCAIISSKNKTAMYQAHLNRPAVKMTKILFLIIALLIATALPASAADRIVSIYNWSDHIDPSILEDFTRETGIKVIYDTFDTSDELERRMLAGSAGYDLIVPSAAALQRLIQADALQPLNRQRLANAVNLWPEIDRRLKRFDPDNAHAVNYLWMTAGVAFNTTKTRDRFGKPLTNWDQLLRPEAIKKFSDCGVTLPDRSEAMMALALSSLKIDPNAKNPDQLRRAADLLSSLRRYIKKYNSDGDLNLLALGESCLAVAWSGDALLARARARELGAETEIAFVAPSDGTLLSLDNLAIPRNAPHLNEAYMFIDYLLRPDIAARNVKATNFSSGVLSARQFMDPSLANDPVIYPPQETLARMFILSAADQSSEKLIDKLWSSVKTGR